MNNRRPQTAVSDFVSVLNLRGSDGLPRIVVGGHAVNIWAEYYLPREPKLSKFVPFLSKDLDLLGNHVDLESLAMQTGYPCERAENKMFIPSTGHVLMPFKDGHIVKIDVLKRIYGVSTEKIRDSAIELRREKVLLRVIDPLHLLQAKTENAVHLPQNKEGFERQDERHMRIMLLCTHEYLKDGIMATGKDKSLVRNCLDLHEQLIAFIKTNTALLASKMYGINWKDVFPLKKLEQCPNPRIQNFYKIRLAKCFP